MALKVSNKNRTKLKKPIENTEKAILDEINQVVVDVLLKSKNPFASVPYETATETEEELKDVIRKESKQKIDSEFSKLQLSTILGIFVILALILYLFGKEPLYL